LSGNACAAGIPAATIAIDAALGRSISHAAASDAIADRTSLTGGLTSSTALSATTLAALSLALSLPRLTLLAILSLLLPTSAALSLLTRLPTLSLLLTGLSALASLTGLPVATELASLKLLLAALSALLSLLPLAALAGLTIGLSAQPGELIAQTRHIVHGAGEGGILRSVLRAAHGASRFTHSLTQLLQIIRKRGFGGIGEVAAAQPVRAALHPHSEVALVCAINCASQLRRSRRLGWRKLSRRRSQLLLEARKIVAHLLAIVHHLVDFGRRWTRGRLSSGASGVLLSDQIAHMIRLLFLLGCQLLGRFGH